MKLEILVSTMDQSDLSLAKKMNIKIDTLIINQCNSNGSEEIVFNDYKVRMISYNERGLSKSRNHAIDNTNGDICLIADDDLHYYNGIEDKILELAETHPEISVFIFQMDNHRVNRFKRKYLNFFDILKVSSVQVAFRKECIDMNDIKFLENFGTGSGKYMSGEETIFLNDCLKKNLKIRYFPLTLGNMHESASSWFNGQNEKYFYDKGAVFHELSPIFWRIMSISFAIMKHKKYKKETSFTNALINLFKGGNEYKLNNKINK